MSFEPDRAIAIFHPPRHGASAMNRRTAIERFKRLARLRLVMPILRARHPPEYTARGVAVGLFVALSPTVGVQMVIVLAIWLMVRALRPRWDFNLVVGLAWTWLTNVFTLAPAYYLFMITGQAMMGRWDDFGSYHQFSDLLDVTLSADAHMLEKLWLYVFNLFDAFGLPMFLGCIPWALVGAWLGYRWSLRMVLRHRERRRSRGGRDNSLKQIG